MSMIANHTRFDFFFQAEDGIRDPLVTGVQTCALPISPAASAPAAKTKSPLSSLAQKSTPLSRDAGPNAAACERSCVLWKRVPPGCGVDAGEIGRASCRERVEITVVAVARKIEGKECRP